MADAGTAHVKLAGSASQTEDDLSAQAVVAGESLRAGKTRVKHFERDCTTVAGKRRQLLAVH